MRRRIGASLVGLSLVAVCPSIANAWSVQYPAYHCYPNKVSRSLWTNHGLGETDTSGDAGEIVTSFFCPGFRIQLPDGKYMRRQNTTSIEMSWSIPSGKSLRARVCIVDANGTSGACASSATTQTGSFSGFTTLDSTNLSFWKSGTIGGSFDQYDVASIIVDAAIGTGRIGSYYIAGSD
jgi:hypothetical protein